MKKSAFTGSLLAAFLLGGAGVWGWQHYQHDSAMPRDAAAVNAQAADSPGTSLASAPALDPVKEMERMSREMDEFFKRDDFFRLGGFTGRFGSWFDSPQGAFGTRIEQGEDQHSVFYKMQVGDRDVSNVNVSVENGYVAINAEMTGHAGNAYSQSSISQTFPVPPGVNPDSAKVERKGDSIVVRFEKIA